MSRPKNRDAYNMAVKSLVKLYFVQLDPESNRRERSVVLYSMSEARAFMQAHGIPLIIEWLQNEFRKDQEGVEVWRQIQDFLIENPAVERAQAVHFDEASAARKFLEELEQPGPDDDETDAESGVIFPAPADITLKEALSKLIEHEENRVVYARAIRALSMTRNRTTSSTSCLDPCTIS